MKPCLEPGCPMLVSKGETRCLAHAPEAWANRPDFKERYGMSQSQWQRLRARALRRDGWRCVACGRTHPLQVDHIVGVANGGGNNLDNLQTLCTPCHNDKTKRERRR